MKLDEMSRIGRRATPQGEDRISYSEVPDAFEGTLAAEEVKIDARGTTCIFWTIKLNGKNLVQKYTPTQIWMIQQFAEANRVYDTSELIGKKIGFKKVQIPGTKGYPRWYPQAILD